MMTLPTQNRIHPRTANRRPLMIALASAGTAVTLLASEATDPVGDGTAANFMTAATTQQGLLITSALLLLLSGVLLVPATVGVVQQVSGRRGSGTGHAGAVLLTLGAFGHAMAALFYLVVAAIADSELSTDEAMALVEHLNGSPTIAVAFIPIIAYAVGFLLAFIALWRAGVIPAWVLGTALAAGLIEFAAPGDIVAIGLVKQALGLVAWGYLGWVHWQNAPTAQRPANNGVQDDTDPALQP